MMEAFLQEEQKGAGSASLKEVLLAGVNAWVIGNMALRDDGARELPTKEVLAAERVKQLSERRIEAALLERKSAVAIRYRALPDDELHSLGVQ